MSHRDLAAAIHAAQESVDWGYGRTIQTSLTAALGRFADSLDRGDRLDKAGLTAMAEVAMFLAFQQRSMRFPDDLWDEGRPERDQSFGTWLMQFAADPAEGRRRAAEVVRSLGPVMEGALSERDLVSVYEGQARLIAIIGACSQSLDPEGEYLAIQDAVEVRLGLVLKVGKSSVQFETQMVGSKGNGDECTFWIGVVGFPVETPDLPAVSREELERAHADLRGEERTAGLVERWMGDMRRTAFSRQLYVEELAGRAYLVHLELLATGDVVHMEMAECVKSGAKAMMAVYRHGGDTAAEVCAWAMGSDGPARGNRA